MSPCDGLNGHIWRSFKIIKTRWRSGVDRRTMSTTTYEQTLYIAAKACFISKENLWRSTRAGCKSSSPDLSAAEFRTRRAVGAVAGAMIPELVRELLARRTQQVGGVAEPACALAELNGHQLAAWVRAGERHARFFQEGVEAAWAALDGAKVRTLGYVLADEM